MTDQQYSLATLEPLEQRDVTAEAVAVIDEALARMMQRELIASGEVADLLLDLRMLLTDR